jgi:WD40 repeat protein
VLTTSLDRISGDVQRGKASWKLAVRLWDALTGRELLVLRHESGIQNAAFSPDGQKVVTGLEDGTARLWDAATGAELAVLRGHQGPVGHATLSPDGQKVATASDDGTARLWDAGTGAALAILRGHQGPINQIDFDGDGQRLLTASKDRTARLWDAATGAELAVLRHNKEVGLVLFSPDGKRAFTISAWTVRQWQLPSYSSVADLLAYARALKIPRLSEVQCREFGVPAARCS